MINTVSIAISKIASNNGQIPDVPKNPRFIRDERYKALQQSIAEYPEMLELRELIVFPYRGEYIVIAGNMRYRAMKDANYKECPCKVLAADTSATRLREIAIKDNVPFGQNAIDLLEQDWDINEITKWGLELPSFFGTDMDAMEFNDNGNGAKEQGENSTSKVKCPSCGYEYNP